MVRRWPDAFTLTLSLFRLPTNQPHRAVMPDELAPLGFRDGDPERFVLDLTGHGVSALLVGTMSASYDRDDLEPGTSVIAVPWMPEGLGSAPEVFGLWTTSV